MNFLQRYRSVGLRALGTLLLAFLMTRIIDVQEVWKAMHALDRQSVIAISLMTLVSWCIAIMKWKVLLRPVPIVELARFHFLGMLYSQILPGQLAGEAVKAVRLAHGRNDLQLSTVTASVIVDRLTGLIALGMVSGVGLLFSSAHVVELRRLGALICAFTIAFTLILFSARLPLLLRLASRVQAWSEARAGLRGRIGREIHRLVDAWRELISDWSLTGKSIALGLAFQVIAIWTVKVIADGVGAELALADAAWVLGIVSVAVLIPISLGGLGVRELSFVAILGVCGVPPVLALSIGIICSLITIGGALIGLAVEAVPAVE
jgi:uncharacterized protein (TIRG00374 family)